LCLLVKYLTFQGELKMVLSNKVKVLFLTILFLILNSANSFAEKIVTPENSVSSNLNPSSKWVQLAEINEVESFIFNRDKNPRAANQRMTWEGVLATDSPQKASCKKECLANYGQDKSVASCDDKAWNNCMTYMDWGFLLFRKECKGSHEAECQACWEKHTQSCYDKSFKNCLDYCK
jgi:hypothetical protein